MKSFVLGVAITVLLLATLATAEVNEYVFDIKLDADRKSSVKLLITFSEFTERFDFMIFGKIENFNATAPKPISCDVKVGEVSSVSCLINLAEKEVLKITFDTQDFVKILDKQYYFLADLSLGKNIKRLNGVVRIPEGMVLVEGKIFPPEGKPTSDGRRIIVMWRYEDIQATQALKFQLAYEHATVETPLVLSPWYFVAVAVIAALLPTYLMLRKVRKPKEIILSVLDEFERKVLDAIIASGGRVNQKKVVQQTGLSKAKVSRVVKSLAERKLITVERMGRTNILKLVKKKFEL